MQLRVVLVTVLSLLQGCVYSRSGVLMDDIEFVGLEVDISQAGFYQTYRKEWCEKDVAKLRTEYPTGSVDHVAYAEFIKIAKDAQVKYITNLTGTNKTRWLWLVIGTIKWHCVLLEGDFYR